MRLEQRRVRLREVPAGGQRPGAREQELDPLVTRGVAGQQAQRDREPVGRAGRRAVGGCLACLAQRRHGRRVALAAGALDVVRALGGTDAARGQRVGTALVGAEPPAARRRLVDRPPHERVPEAEAAWHVGLTDHVAIAAARPPLRARRHGPRRLRPPRAPDRRDRPRRPHRSARGARRRGAARAPRQARPRRAEGRADRRSEASRAAPTAARRAVEALRSCSR